RCRRIRTPYGLSCRVQSLLPSLNPRSRSGREDPARGGAKWGSAGRRWGVVADVSQLDLSIATANGGSGARISSIDMSDGAHTRYDPHAIEARRQAARGARETLNQPT